MTQDSENGVLGLKMVTVEKMLQIGLSGFSNVVFIASCENMKCRWISFELISLSAVERISIKKSLPDSKCVLRLI